MKLLITVAAIVILPFLAETGLVVPAEKPDATPMVDGTVRAIARTGDNVWVGGRFNRIVGTTGSPIDGATNVAVFDAATGRYKDIAPAIGGDGSEVWDMDPYGDDLVIAGSFTGPDGSRENLVLVDGATGRAIRWYDAPPLKSVLAAPEMGRIYAGGDGLSAFEVGGRKLWTRAKAAIDPHLRPQNNAPAYRDLELDGRTIWAACVCDAVNGDETKALVKLNTEGVQDASWSAAGIPSEAFGLSVAERQGALYLGAGGSDFLARYSKADGRREWVRDTSGSVQAVEVADGGLVAGGHFWEVADGPDDACGHRSSGGSAELDPNDECETRHGLAAYSFEGDLDADWNPVVSGRYSLVWALLSDKSRLHFGGEFTEVEDEAQRSYARLPSPTR